MSSWISCQKIVSNLWESYKATSHSVSWMHFGAEQKSQELILLAQRIVEERPEIISFIDHRPHPYDLLQYLIPFWLKTNAPLPQIIFHIYGDFTLNYHKWANLAHLLKGIKVKFCVASSSQQKLISKLTTQDIHIIPFSVNSSEFFYDENLRKKTRDELKIKDEKLFIFTGRLSYQKNIHLLVKEFLSYLDHQKTNDKLLIFGHFDDLGDSFTGYKALIGHYFHQVNNLLINHPRKDQIQFMGMASSKELNAYYNASDFFINLSTHNDEDFGMSVAEASLCGLASILTAWGGLNDFDLTSTRYLKVSIDGEKKIDLSLLPSYMSGSTHYDRFKLAHEASLKFSNETASKNIDNMLSMKSKDFEDFTELFYQVYRTVLYTKNVYLDSNHRLNSLYRNLYESYLG